MSNGTEEQQRQGCDLADMLEATVIEAMRTHDDPEVCFAALNRALAHYIAYVSARYNQCSHKLMLKCFDAQLWYDKAGYGTMPGTALFRELERIANGGEEPSTEFPEPQGRA